MIKLGHRESKALLMSVDKIEETINKIEESTVLVSENLNVLYCQVSVV